MKKTILSILLAASVGSANAQYSDNYFDVGLFGGFSTYQGDLGNFFDFKHVHGAAGVFGRYSIGKWVSVRGQFNYTVLTGSDRDSDVEERRIRNLNFMTDIYEGALTAEWNLLGYHPRAMERTFSPFLFFGVSGFYFNPIGTFDGGGDRPSRVNLIDIGADGQSTGYRGRTGYSRIQLSLPMGLGVKYAINSRWGLGVELGVRKTFTDYLDNVSSLETPPWEALSSQAQAWFISRDPTKPMGTYIPGVKRGDASDTDWIMFGGLTVSYHFLDEGLVGSRKRGRRKQGCRGVGF